MAHAPEDNKGSGKSPEKYHSKRSPPAGRAGEESLLLLSSIKRGIPRPETGLGMTKAGLSRSLNRKWPLPAAENLLAGAAIADYLLTANEMTKPRHEHEGHAKVHIYWHRELPPLDAEPMGEHVVEAASERVPHMLVERDELWDRCYEELMIEARRRLEQEVARLGGNSAHVLDESVESKHDGATGEGWLHGRFTYMLYRNSR